MSSESSVKSESTWFRRYHPAPDARSRLFCFPHAGGSASYFISLSRLLTPDVEVVAIQYPGRQDRRFETCADSIPELAERISDALPDWTGLPYCFFGHSMGAIVAFEVTRRFERRLISGPACLFASGRRAPHRQRDERFHEKDDPELVAELRLLGATHPAFLKDQEFLDMILPVVRADYRAVAAYRCSPDRPLTCPITVLVGDSDPRTTLDEAAAWRDHSTGAFDLRVFSGGHFYLQAHQAAITALIRAVLVR